MLDFSSITFEIDNPYREYVATFETNKIIFYGIMFSLQKYPDAVITVDGSKVASVEYLQFSFDPEISSNEDYNLGIKIGEAMVAF